MRNALGGREWSDVLMVLRPILNLLQILVLRPALRGWPLLT